MSFFLKKIRRIERNCPGTYAYFPWLDKFRLAENYSPAYEDSNDGKDKGKRI